MKNSFDVVEEDVVCAAKLAGISLTPEFRSRILARLQELRDGVLGLSDTIDENTIPATRFSAE